MRQIATLLFCLAGSLHATTYYITVAGLGGEKDYEQRFQSLAQEANKVVSASGSDVKAQALYGADASKAKLQAAMAQVARTATAQDAVVLMLIGHGTFDGEEYKFNLPGPDVTAAELASWLDKVPAGRQLVVNMTSASGASLGPLQKANRAIVTATKGGNEKNATVFARYWVEALRDAAADTDKNDVITALEAYRYADQKTKDFYEAQKRLATEHALLSDSGKGEGVRAPGPDNGQGLVASRFALLHIGATQTAARSPEKQKLLARREELEREIDQLKYKKAAMPADQYRKELTDALLELAKVQQEIDK